MSDELRERAASEPDRNRRLAFVLWNGDVGGAEVLNVKLADQMRQLGADVTIVFVGTPWPLAERLSRANLPYCSLDLGRGRNVLRHPRRYANEITRIGGDGALLMERGSWRAPYVPAATGGRSSPLNTALFSSNGKAPLRLDGCCDKSAALREHGPTIQRSPYPTSC